MENNKERFSYHQYEDEMNCSWRNACYLLAVCNVYRRFADVRNRGKCL